MEDLIVVGGGIIGLATAREALRRRPGSSIVVLESADTIASEQTGHNSGVIHAGLYYAPGSLKARLCKIGAEETLRFCDEHEIEYQLIGKLVVATSKVELNGLEALADRSSANGINLQRISGDELREMEPNVRGVAALLSPNTGIIDFRAVAQSMAAEIEQMGGRVVTRSEVFAIRENSSQVVVESATGEYGASSLVACAGLQADRIARMGGLTIDFRIVPFRGEYYQLPQFRNGLVQHLIYPVPDPALPFLGIHLSPTIDRRITVGPNAVLGFSRTQYRRGAVTWRDVFNYAAFPGMWSFARQNIRVGVTEMLNSWSKKRYLELVRKYCPSLEVDDLLPYPAGIRAQALLENGKAAEDFLIRRSPRQVHVCNAPSPAATSAIPIGSLINDEIFETAH